MEKYCGSAIKVSQGKELEISFLAPLAEANPQVATENDENFKKSDIMENSIFSPSNSSGSRNPGKLSKSSNYKAGIDHILKTDKYGENLKKDQKLKTQKKLRPALGQWAWLIEPNLLEVIALKN